MNEDQLAEFRQKYVGFVFQSYNLLPTLTAMENVTLPLIFRGVPVPVSYTHLLNLMPNKIETEVQLMRLLSNTPLQVEIELLQMKSHNAKNTASEYLDAFYKTFDDVKDQKFDGLIITGAPIENYDFQDVDFWPELCEILELSLIHIST